MVQARKPEKVLRKQAVYGHDIQRVWAAMTTPEALAQWLMPNNFAPEVGREFEFRVDPSPAYQGLVKCRVLELDPPRKMVWSWVTCGKAGKMLPPMRIEWTLEPDAAGRGTRLTLTQTGLEGQPWIFNLMMAMGWGTMMKRWLPKVLDAFEATPSGLVYRRMAKPPNRGHHKAEKVPAGFAK